MYEYFMVYTALRAWQAVVRVCFIKSKNMDLRLKFCSFNLALISYSRDTWSLTIREQLEPHRLKVSDSDCSRYSPLYHKHRDFVFGCIAPDIPVLSHSFTQIHWGILWWHRADSRLAPSQSETSLQNDVSDWLGASLESDLYIMQLSQCQWRNSDYRKNTHCLITTKHNVCIILGMYFDSMHEIQWDDV